MVNSTPNVTIRTGDVKPQVLHVSSASNVTETSLNISSESFIVGANMVRRVLNGEPLLSVE